MKIALVSTPWPLFNRPSIQLATLKAYLREHLPGAQVHAHHFYLNIAAGLGYGLYTEISESTRLSEIPYAALLFPELGEEMERLWRRATRGAKEAGGMALSQVRRALERESLRALESVAWDGFDLVGLSICLGQLTSSLYFIREIKRLAPGSRVVVGGSSCAGELGRSLMTAFPAIDHVIFGEGERPMLHLAREAASGKSVPSPFPGLLSPGDPVSPQGSSQVEDPDTLPMPDFDDYFSTLQSLPQEKAFHPRIPMEMSRGCWWRGADPDGERGCAFCNLNLQWSGYRHKSPARVAGELEILSEKYGTLSFSFMDNLLPAQGLGETCRLIRELDRDFRLFAEIRATTPRRTLLAMRRAGIRHVQVGIEALSTGLLRKLRKGTSAIANLEIMKHCETPEAPDLSANLILEFPSSDEKDVAHPQTRLFLAGI
ncbi:MAG: RiPP maturation radical SAM C-methyltransferase [Deltaproteobacteria bacterium]|nr:RiPP maturation radical SAM C-methyltransferase [Deltaproteobacteria bacterium]